MDKPLLWFWDAYGVLVGFLYRSGSPAWLVNLPRALVPDALMFAAAHAYLRRTGEES